MKYRIVLFFQEKSLFSLAPFANDDDDKYCLRRMMTYHHWRWLEELIFFTVEVGGWVMPKSDDSNDENIAPVEVAGGVMPKRALWLVLGPDNDDEKKLKMTMKRIWMMLNDYDGDYDV